MSITIRQFLSLPRLTILSFIVFLLTSSQQSWAQVACYQIFGFKEIRGLEVADQPNPPRTQSRPFFKDWFSISKQASEITKGNASFQGHFRSSFYGLEIKPEVAEVLNRWNSWSEAKFTVFENQYRMLNPNHENYLKRERPAGEPEVRLSARVFPSEEPVVVHRTSGGELRLLHNGTKLGELEVLQAVHREIPPELPQDMVAVFRGPTLRESLAQNHNVPVPFVLMRPVEYGTYRRLSEEEVVKMVIQPPEGEKYAPIPQGAVIVERPAHIPEGATVEYGVRLAFNSLRYRNRPVIPFIGYVIVKDGRILEVGAGSRELVREVKSLISHGRNISREEQSEIAQFTTKLFETIGRTSESREAIKGFRGWPQALIEKSGVVHFDPSRFDLETWALNYGKEKGWTEEKTYELLVLSGWAEVGFNRFGRKSYRILREEGDLVPFFKDHDRKEISYFRMRRSNPPPKSSKYREFPELYDVANSPREDDVFFSPFIKGSENLKSRWLQGVLRQKRRLVVTEGEFKSLVAEWYGPWPVVALSGIHSYNTQSVTRLAERIHREGIDEVVVIFDGDPKGKGLARADGLSDSKRQAYAFGREMEEALKVIGLSGKVQVKVGLLPSTGKPGAKDAIDDLILEDPKAGLKSYEQAVVSARPLSEYAKQIRLDEVLVEFYSVQRSLEISLREARAAREAGIELSRQQIQVLERAEALHRVVTEQMNLWLKKNYKVDTLQTAEKTITRIPPAGKREEFRPQGQILLERAGNTVDLTSYFRHEFILAPVVSRTQNNKGLCQMASCMRMPYTDRELAEIIRTGSSQNSKLVEDFNRGVQWAVLQDRALETPQDFRTAILAGYLSNRFYPGEIIEFAPRLEASQKLEISSAILVRRNSSGNAIGVFFASPTEADPQIRLIWEALRPGLSPVR